MSVDWQAASSTMLRTRSFLTAFASLHCFMTRSSCRGYAVPQTRAYLAWSTVAREGHRLPESATPRPGRPTAPGLRVFSGASARNGCPRIARRLALLRDAREPSPEIDLSKTLQTEDERHLTAVIGVVREEPKEHGRARVELHLAFADAARLLFERVGRPRREAASDDLPRRLERVHELVGAARMLEVVLPAGVHEVEIAERGRLRARLLEDVAEPHHARARDVRRARPYGPARRSDRELQLLGRQVAQPRDESLVLELPAAVERRYRRRGHHIPRYARCASGALRSSSPEPV